MKKPFFIFLFFLTAAEILFSESVQDRIINKARTLIGTPYRTGGVSPSGFDCSGFITYLYKTYVPELPRVSRDMARTGAPVSRNKLAPGDLVFFATGSEAGRVTHVALYIGQNSIIHSISNGPERGVTISSLNAGYWRKRYHNSSRLIAPASASDVSQAENILFAKGIYNGDLKNGEPSGNGILLMKNGDRYEGSFEKGLFHGSGTYIWADGRFFEGSFENGDFAGKGTMVMTDGEKIAGSWSGGEFKAESSAETAADLHRPDGKSPALSSAPSRSSENSSGSGAGGGIDTAKTESKPADGKALESVSDSPGGDMENYLQKEDSPWNTYEGIVDGDFSLWYKKDMEKFEEWKKTH